MVTNFILKPDVDFSGSAIFRHTIACAVVWIFLFDRKFVLYFTGRGVLLLFRENAEKGK